MYREHVFSQQKYNFTTLPKKCFVVKTHSLVWEKCAHTVVCISCARRRPLCELVTHKPYGILCFRIHMLFLLILEHKWESRLVKQLYSTATAAAKRAARAAETASTGYSTSFYIIYLENMTFHRLKGQCHEIFDLMFFSWISFTFPQAKENPNRAVSNFLKFAETFAAHGAPPVLLTLVANVKNLHLEKFNYLFGHLWVV
jgi:hypothetical protein